MDNSIGWVVTKDSCKSIPVKKEVKNKLQTFLHRLSLLVKKMENYNKMNFSSKEICLKKMRMTKGGFPNLGSVHKIKIIQYNDANKRLIFVIKWQSYVAKGGSGCNNWASSSLFSKPRPRWKLDCEFHVNVRDIINQISVQENQLIKISWHSKNVLYQNFGYI